MVRWRVLAKNLDAEAILRYYGSGPKGNIKWSGENVAADHEALEGTVRLAVAARLGEDLTAAGKVYVEGKSMSRMRDDRNRDYVPLSDWCQAMDIDLTTNSMRCTAAITYHGKQVIIPLSANQIKVGSKWEKLDGGFVVEVSGKWYLPLAALDQL